MARTNEEARAYQRGYYAGQKTAARCVEHQTAAHIQLRGEYRELTDAVEAYCLASESGLRGDGRLDAYQRMRAALNTIHGGDIVGIKLKVAD